MFSTMLRFIIMVILLIGASHSYSQDTLQRFVTKWLGKPYRYGGKTERGIDCSAFTQKLYKEIYNKDIPRTCGKQLKLAEKIDPRDLRIGDLLYFRSSSSPSGRHCGVYIGNDVFIHAANRKTGVIISCIFDPHYQSTLVKIGRF